MLHCKLKPPQEKLKPQEEDSLLLFAKQRPYKYNFSLHINFFPYRWSLVGQLGYRPDVTIKDLGDWFYRERGNTYQKMGDQQRADADFAKARELQQNTK